MGYACTMGGYCLGVTPAGKIAGEITLLPPPPSPPNGKRSIPNRCGVWKDRYRPDLWVERSLGWWLADKPDQWIRGGGQSLFCPVKLLFRPAGSREVI